MHRVQNQAGKYLHYSKKEDELRKEKERRERELMLRQNGDSLGNYNLSNFRQKRKRKRKDEVVRSFRCPIDNCMKAYGSENSLNQHIKFKHHDEILRQIL